MPRASVQRTTRNSSPASTRAISMIPVSTPAFLKAMHDVRLSHGPIGPVRLDEYGTPILDIYIRKVARVNGKLANTILKTYPQVSQFWTYDPAQFVTQPPFSRDYPPSKNLE